LIKHWNIDKSPERKIYPWFGVSTATNGLVRGQYAASHKSTATSILDAWEQKDDEPVSGK
jgi:uncharacterized protein (DUF924 family)